MRRAAGPTRSPYPHAAWAEGAAADGAAIPVRAAARIMSEAFSAIMITVALVLPETTVGITEASTTRSPSMPRTRNSLSTTARSSGPIMQVEVG